MNINYETYTLKLKFYHAKRHNIITHVMDMGCIFMISLENECRIENMGVIKFPCLQLLVFNLYLHSTY
jgi:hypothetical protein